MLAGAEAQTPREIVMPPKRSKGESRVIIALGLRQIDDVAVSQPAAARFDAAARARAAAPPARFRGRGTPLHAFAILQGA